MRNSHTKTGRLVLCALFAALLAVCSQIQIPLPGGVPVNLALFAVYLAGALLGAQLGTLSVFVWIMLAAVGVPVMAGFQGGLGALLGKTGGFILGYLLAAMIVGICAPRCKNRMLPLCGAMVLGCLACYTFGSIWFMVLLHVDLYSTLTWCVIPFLPGDAVKIILAGLVTVQLKQRAGDLLG